MIDDALMAKVQQAALAAGECAMHYHGKDNLQVRNKSDGTPVSNADIETDDIICQALRDVLPDSLYLSEEKSVPPLTQRQQHRFMWLVDPIDGTRQYISGGNEFTVNIALIENNQAVLGLVYAPATGELYYAIKGAGAYKQLNADAEKTQIHSRRLQEDGTIILATSMMPESRYLKHLQTEQDVEWMRVRSSLKTCLIAEGRADIYPGLGPTAEWDTAAAQIILEEAGGKLVDLRRQSLRYCSKESMMNPKFLAYADGSMDWLDWLNISP